MMNAHILQMHYTLWFISDLEARTENLHTVQKGQTILRMQLAIDKLKYGIFTLFLQQ